MTPDVMKLFSDYNILANNEMNRSISLLSQSEWEKEFDGYFKSIKAICAHLYIGDFFWLKRFGILRQFEYLKHPVFEKALAWDASPFETIEEYLLLRKELDAVLAAFVSEVTADDCAANISYKNWKNEDQNRNVGGLMLHLFNHHTHHRGIISLYLDFLGKENDFSNLLYLV